jgi:hypothetical protein
VTKAIHGLSKLVFEVLRMEKGSRSEKHKAIEQRFEMKQWQPSVLLSEEKYF